MPAGSAQVSLPSEQSTEILLLCQLIQLALISSLSSGKQQMPRSDCALAQSDVGFCYLHVFEVPFYKTECASFIFCYLSVY